MNKKFFLSLCASVLVTLSASATSIDQYADTVIDFSSQWSTGSWAANQALGAPTTFGYGDISTSWAPASLNGTLEYITVGFAQSVYADGVTIRETDGNGFVYQVDVLDTANVLHTVWTGTDSSVGGTPVDFLVSFSATSYLVQGVKIYVDTNHDLGNWEEIDSIQLHGSDIPGSTSSVPDSTSTLALLGAAMAGFVGLKRRKIA